jgi:hypothetical protein
MVVPLISTTSVRAEVGSFYVRCVFHILVWLCYLDAHLRWKWTMNLYGLTTSMCRVDERFVSCTTFCSMFDRSGCKP